MQDNDSDKLAAGIRGQKKIQVDSNCTPENVRAAAFRHVKAAEEEQVRQRREAFGLPLKDKGDQRLLGLAISGGGIRSATFSLGIIQRLAEGGIEHGLLKHLDYLSTVSGGGYVGSWLYSWIQRAEADQIGAATGDWEDGTQGIAERKLQGFENVNSGLRADRTHESPQITFLRQYSNYLTPRVSLFSADTWVVGAIWARNTLLNVTILIAVIAAAVLIIRGLGMAALRFVGPAWNQEGSWQLAVCAGLLLPMLGCMGWNLWRNSKIALDPNPPPNREREANNTEVIWFCLFPVLSAVAYSFWLGKARHLFVEGTLLNGVWPNFWPMLAAFLWVQLCALLYRCHLAKQKQIKGEVGLSDKVAALFCFIYAPAASAFVTAALLRTVALIFETQFNEPDKPWFVLTLGPPLVLIAFTLGMIVHIGLMGRDLPEASREWLGRLRGWLIIVTVGWMGVAGIAIYGPWFVAWLTVQSKIALATLGSGWILSTAVGLFAGNSDKTNGKAPDDARQPRGKSLLETLAGIAPYVFMLGFTVMIAFGVHCLLANGLYVTNTPAKPNNLEKYDLKVKNNNIQITQEQQKFEDSGAQWILGHYWSHLTCTEPIASNTNPTNGVCMSMGKRDRWALSGLLPLLGVLVLAGGLLAWRVDINVFSMFYFYKNRLVRCFLGASRQRERKPSPFTGFDDFDDTHLCRFTYENNYLGPYPIMNAALNVTSGGKLQYQERKAQSFVFTPLYTGFSSESVVDEMRLADSTRPVAEYQEGEDSEPSSPGIAARGQARGYRPTAVAGGGVSVGMAMGISGAAANPNMGYHTSLAVSFLLTVFNVRLGWWFGNALKKTFNSPGPKVGLMYSFRELFGLANADSSFVSLSDGGHFDNMGIYELVRRGCQYIVCCDGEQDGNLTFNGIGNAIRKCRTDFGVDIDLPVTPLRRDGDFSGAHCVVGRIKYPAVAAAGSAASGASRAGYILYLKASLTGDEATDVLEYHARQPEFPHQSTGDQWFDESQFESYRKLGYHVADKALCGVSMGSGDAAARENFFCSLSQIWYPRSTTVEKNSAAHTDMYNRILESVRREKDLKDLDPDLFESYSASSNGWDHNAGHLCNSFIQLMERVFYDLGLQDRDSWQHPYVMGWIDIFRYWVSRESFAKTWTVTKSSYPERFVAFYESLAQKTSAAAGATMGQHDGTS